MALSKKKSRELSIKEKVLVIKQKESEGKSQRELAKIFGVSKTLYQIEKGLCEMSTAAMKQKSIRDFF